ncbi:MAG: DUF4956 domain-containing protein [Clostridiales bacterium]|nr:DUF4956 domain-containing protein [Clostridiales bacterium]
MNNIFAELTSSMTLGVSSIPTILLAMVLALVLGLVIAFIYKRNYRGVMYSNNFALTLVMMTLITTPVVLCIRNSIALSMGMVGALSIVRFRTAVKDPLDTAYMFWALTTGILLGAGQWILTAVTVVAIGLMLTLIVNLKSKPMASYLLVVRMNEEADKPVAQLANAQKGHKLKSKNFSAAGIEVTYELTTEKPDQLMAKVRGVRGVADATLVSYQGDAI